MSYKRFYLHAIACWGFILLGQPYTAFAQNPIVAALNTLAQDSSMRHAAWGFCAIDIASGNIIAERQPQTALLPASSLKTVTTASALAMLGANYQYDTKLAFRETPMTDEDDPQGDFVLLLSGDPSLCSKHNEFAISPKIFYNNLLQAAQNLQSPLLTDYTQLEPNNDIWDATPPESWENGDLTEPYAAVAQSFNICDNELQADVRIKLDPTALYSDDSPYAASLEALYPNFFARDTEPLEPPETNISIDKTCEKNTLALNTDSNPWLLTAKLKTADTLYHIAVANRNAWLDFEAMFANDIGILAATQRPKQQPLPRVANLRILYTHSSPPLSYLVRRCNEKSINLYAEAFLKTIGKKFGKGGTDEAGIKALTQYWQQRGISFEGCEIADGSGVSRQNAATPFFLANFMRTVYQDPIIGQTFYNSLAIAGETGTLEPWLKDSPARHKIRAKTGSMRRVLTYTGYAPDRNGNLIAFSLLVNNYNGDADEMRKKMTAVLAKLVE